VAQVRFYRSRAGQRIAYVDEGEGPRLALPAWWVSHLERDAEGPEYRRFFDGLSARFRVLRYDRVGVGLSDRARRTFTLASELADFTELVEHLGVERLHLLGCSCAGPVALAYAAEHPERVDRVVLYGSYLHGESLSPPEVRQALVALVRAHGRLGARTLADVFFPAADAEARERFNALQRESAEPETAARLLELTYDLDARPFTARVRAPVLVLHRKDDPTIRHDEARKLTVSLPQAVLTTLSGSAHMPWLGDGDALIEAIAGFLGGSSSPRGQAGRDASLRRDGEVWTIRFEGRQSLLRDCKGLVDLARLIGRPGEPLHVFDLAGSGELERRDGGRADPALDLQALASYRRRLTELDEALAEAEACADVGRRSKLHAEREALLGQLAADTGRGGRARRLNDPVERARKAVTARLRDAIRRVKDADRGLGEHLERAVQTGIFCVYRPSDPVTWSVSPDRI
jgi:pimeloyl-ACP methyl ester carboxylesterase